MLNSSLHTFKPSSSILILLTFIFQIWRYGAKYRCRQINWRCLLSLWSARHSPSRPRHCVEFLSHLSPKSTGRQTKSPKGIVISTISKSHIHIQTYLEACKWLNTYWNEGCQALKNHDFRGMPVV